MNGKNKSIMYKGQYKCIDIALTGDVMLSKRLPNVFSDKLETVRNILMRYDCRIGNLETTVHHYEEGYPEAFPGGSYAMMCPAALEDLKNLGFNMFSTANNHSMDYSHEGLLATLRYLREKDISCAGTGKNLADASRPVYFDCQNGRIALISITSSFHDSYLAGPQNQDLQGRPGVNPLRHNAIYELDEEDYQVLTSIAAKTGINSYHNQAVKEGYLQNNENFKFGNLQFIKGKSGVFNTTPNESDLTRTIKGIENAKYFSDVVIVSVHSHQFKEKDKKLTPDFISIFAKRCIDAGADIIVCHGPHLLRGIEIYKSGVIFHGLGNFILQQDQMNVLAEEQYMKYGTTRQNCNGEGDLYALQTQNNNRGLNVIPDTWKSVLVGIHCVEDLFSIKLYPVILDRYGICSLSHDNSILQEIEDRSKEFGTQFIIDEQQKCGLIEFKR